MHEPDDDEVDDEQTNRDPRCVNLCYIIVVKQKEERRRRKSVSVYRRRGVQTYEKTFTNRDDDEVDDNKTPSKSSKPSEEITKLSKI